MTAVSNSPKTTTTKLSRFVVVGVIATCIHIIIATYLITGNLTANNGSANTVAFVIATTFSYLVNTKWSFTESFTVSNFSKFLFTALFGGLLAFSLSTLVDYLGFNYLVGIGVIVLIVPAMTFLLHNFWTYRQPKP